MQVVATTKQEYEKAQIKEIALEYVESKNPLDEYINQTSPFVVPPKHQSRFSLETAGVQFSMKGKNVLQGMMTAYTSNEGMGVSIRQNVLKEDEDAFRDTMQGFQYKNSIKPNQEQRNYYRGTAGRAGYSTR